MIQNFQNAALGLMLTFHKLVAILAEFRLETLFKLFPLYLVSFPSTLRKSRLIKFIYPKLHQSVMSSQNFDYRRPLFDFTAECTRLGVPEKCGIGTDGDGNIMSLGPWQRGTFEPRVDIAGPGVPMIFNSPCQSVKHREAAD